MSFEFNPPAQQPHVSVVEVPDSRALVPETQLRALQSARFERFVLALPDSRTPIVVIGPWLHRRDGACRREA